MFTKKIAKNSDDKIVPTCAENDDADVITTLRALKSAIDLAYRNLDTVIDDDLIDGYIYELKAANMKYQYYLKLCKERGLMTQTA